MTKKGFEYMPLNEETRYKLLQALSENPNLSQRQLAKELGISLGKVNYCLNALLEVGLVKASNFKNSQNKTRYAYFLTPKGVEEKAVAAKVFVRKRLAEISEIEKEIENARAQVGLDEFADLK